ncbi:uncharacterized protein HMPREF1541_03437 [Cyphellophora europaea CBS 101466]|uniref:DUF726-domain-containing protein n=1 Tax=Cyphellophora europaea (strain CBS 101466) TaxID=1220924 RepID=W2RYC9_CYPE1|nr:uncharacterized protein HMPREF1541_03437 [Cyphellophora europaea CBS 101466]ETN41501.1 hypothetical protein HMPREF1541_03437 [Cyphellophora europaea CBS 101466]
MPFKLPSKLPSKLPFGSGGEPANKPKEPSLDDVLPTKALRVELVVLIALCTEAMRNGLNATFERNKDQNKSEYTSALNRDDLWGNRAAETVVQDAGVAYLNNWRTDVLRKTGEALGVQSGDVKHRKDAYLAETRTTNTTMLDGGSRDTWLPFRPVQPPSLLMQELDDSKRALVVGAVLFILLSLENYPAHSRVLLLFLCECFDLPVDVLSSAEATTALTLLKSAESSGVDTSVQTDEARLAQAEKNRQGRKWKIGLATVAGAVAIGITGGLAAPLLLGAAGAIMGGVGLGGLATLLGATIANPLTIAALFGALGGRMTGKAMEEYAREVEDFRFVPTKTKPDGKEEQHKLRVAIGVAGWIQEEHDVIQPWKVFSDAALEPFGLRYELGAMTSLTAMLDTLLKDTAYSVAQAGALKLLLPVLSAAMLPVTLMKAGKFLDNPFTIAMERSDKAGKVLAHALIAKAQGERPVTLIGFSLGGRVVYACLQELAVHKAFGLVESAILIGAPVPSDMSTWRTMRAMVVGRLLNVYASKDYLLGFLYRARNAQLGVSGLQAINGVPGVESVDVSETVTGHNQYRLAVGKILREIRYTDLDLSRVEDEEQELEAEKIKEQAIYEEAKRNGRLQGEEDENGQLKMSDAADLDNGSAKTGDIPASMRDLQGLTLDEPPAEKQQKPEPAPIELPVPESEVPKRKPVPMHEERAPPLPKRNAEPLTPTSSEDEDEDHHQPITLTDLEPEAVPDTPPRPGQKR